MCREQQHSTPHWRRVATGVELVVLERDGKRPRRGCQGDYPLGRAGCSVPKSWVLVSFRSRTRSPYLHPGGESDDLAAAPLVFSDWSITVRSPRGSLALSAARNPAPDRFPRPTRRSPITPPLFAWEFREDRPRIAPLRDFLATRPDGKLLDSLRQARGKGRDD